jgi:DNA-binding HxlR family transcriptional regulator
VRSYGQFCGVARALDEIGDRWSLLIIRELAIRDCRFTDLLDGLPGIATNLLSDRLRDLQAREIIDREGPAPPVSTPLYTLTPRGRQLLPVLRELARWAMPLMAPGQGDDHARGHWLVLAVEAIFAGASLAGPEPLTVEIETEGETLSLVADSAGVHARAGSADAPAARLSGPAEAIVAALVGADHPELVIEGDRPSIRRLHSAASAARELASDVLSSPN